MIRFSNRPPLPTRKMASGDDTKEKCNPSVGKFFNLQTGQVKNTKIAYTSHSSGLPVGFDKFKRTPVDSVVVIVRNSV